MLDVDSLARNAGVGAAVTAIVDDFFEPSVHQRIVSDVAEHALDAVVLAGNTIEHFSTSLSGRYLRQDIVAAGVSPNRVTSANLLEQCALAHEGDPDREAKALAAVRVASLEAMMSPAMEWVDGEPVRSVLILGVTTEGLVAAQRLLALGYSVTVADRSNGSERAARANVMAATAAYVTGHHAATLLDHAVLVDGAGWVGDFDIMLESSGRKVPLKVGGVLLAEPHRAEWVSELRLHFKLDVDDEGCARAVDPATHPAETVDPGIMVVPVRSDHAPTCDKVAAADSAVVALVLRLSQPSTRQHAKTSSVDEDLCGGCASCVKTCAFGACRIGEDGMSHVDMRRCRGCGKCVVSCPVGARDVVTSPHDYVLAAIHELAKTKTSRPKVMGFLCGGCGYPAADSAGRAADGSAAYPAAFMPLRIPCGGRLDTVYVLEALAAGFEGVMVFRCREGHCHNLIGNLDMDRRINLLRTVLRSRAIDDSCLRLADISPGDGAGFAESVNGFYAMFPRLAVAEGGAR